MKNVTKEIVYMYVLYKLLKVNNITYLLDT